MNWLARVFASAVVRRLGYALAVVIVAVIGGVLRDLR